MTHQPGEYIGVIEDDLDIANLVKRYLDREGFKVRLESGTRDWEQFILSPSIKLLILDWMLPDQSGLEIIKKVRSSPQFKNLPILMLTARVDDTDVVRAFEAGADDFVAKPFSASVLMARVHALLRRTQVAQTGVNSSLENPLSFGLLRLEPTAHKIYLGKDLLNSVTVSEYKLLETLMRNPGKVLTRSMMIENLKGPGISVVERTIDNHVLSLRKKLGTQASNYIETVRGVGYRFSQNPQGQIEL